MWYTGNMKVLYWNVYVGHNPDHVMSELREMAKEHKPHVIGLGEGSRIEGRSEHVPGYRAFWLKETYRGRGDTIALVRDDVNLRKWNWMEMTKWWTGPKHGWPQGPKRYWNGRLRFGRFGLLRLSIAHWPFNDARPETEERVVKWFKRAPLRRSVHLGDLNMRADDMDRFVKKFRGKHVGVGIDRAMFKRCHVTARDLGNHGSDHPAVLFNITRKK